MMLLWLLYALLPASLLADFTQCVWGMGIMLPLLDPQHNIVLWVHLSPAIGLLSNQLCMLARPVSCAPVQACLIQQHSTHASCLLLGSISRGQTYRSLTVKVLLTCSVFATVTQTQARR